MREIAYFGLVFGKLFSFLGRSGNPIIDTLDIFHFGSPSCNLESTEQQIKYVFYNFFKDYWNL